MSSLAPGNVLRGACWNYRVLEPVKGDNTHNSTVFKAQVIARGARVVPEVPEWALIKVASPSDEISTKNIQREVLTYSLPGIASAKCFRKIYDIIGRRQHYRFGMINRPIAKLGDLGLVIPVGELFNAQPYAMRAPEVFLGQVCTELSQVWAVAAILLYWIKPGILGVWDSPYPLLNEAWAMVKIQRLFPYWEIPPPESIEGDILKVAVKSARSLSQEMPELQAILPFDEEIKKVEMPQQLRDLLRFVLVPDPTTRPSASSVLASREFRKFENYDA
ncbi:uncharacterized protein N7518_005932 [Penicillium psychrosexuale]|uniref:uncharacterized protein n=1 Tax=Penicillium psychrosexuale TaxID=1002107 RepID=UPI002544E6B6|nr:uncharacterized protein N7518_005932 [Penicillium psychrosexuale]KAJ5788921.1 hypothetical protein N7518_005932 [Penicillium psychrosexuale]